MHFTITMTAQAEDDLAYFDAYDQRIIMKAIRTHLPIDPHVPTKRRKQLDAHPVAAWELKHGHYRIFYDIIDKQVDILAIGYKDHNDLFIQGRKIVV